MIRNIDVVERVKFWMKELGLELQISLLPLSKVNPELTTAINFNKGSINICEEMIEEEYQIFNQIPFSSFIEGNVLLALLGSKYTNEEKAIRGQMMEAMFDPTKAVQCLTTQKELLEKIWNDVLNVSTLSEVQKSEIKQMRDFSVELNEQQIVEFRKTLQPEMEELFEDLEKEIPQFREVVDREVEKFRKNIEN